VMTKKSNKSAKPITRRSRCFSSGRVIRRSPPMEHQATRSGRARQRSPCLQAASRHK
jgi:hypothetical protein